MRDGRPVFEDCHAYCVWPRRAVCRPVGQLLGLFDPRGEAKKLFEEHGLPVIDVPSLSNIDPRIEVLVIGPRAFDGDAGPVGTRRGLAATGRTG